MDQLSPVATHEQILRRIRGEYLEMLGLRLKREQAQRLWGLDEVTCTQSLQVLVESGFLSRSVGDIYVRRTDGPAKQPAFSIARSGLGPRRTPRTRKTPGAA